MQVFTQKRFFGYAVGALFALLWVLAAMPSQAQQSGILLCPEMIKPVYAQPSGSGGQDDSYKKEKLAKGNVYGVRPKGEMRGKSTVKLTDLTRDFEYLYRSADDRSNIYTGYSANDTAQGATSGFSRDSLLGPNGCKVLAENMAATNAEFDKKRPLSAEAARRAMIRCANRYITDFQNNPKVIFDPQGRPQGLAEGPELCQPLKLVPVTAEEEGYTPSDNILRAAAGTGTLGNMARSQDLIYLHELAHKHAFDAKTGKNLKGAAADSKGKTYERILDPMHPFSPRYDFDYADRDYPFVERTDPADPKKKTKLADSMFWYQYGYSLPQCAVACAGVPVDIMRARGAEFNQGVSERISANVFFGSLDPKVPPPVFLFRLLSRLMLEQDGKFPVCSTRFDQEDKFPELCQSWLKAHNAPTDFKQSCEKLAAPVIPVNLLKIRTNNQQNFPNGTPKGYTFKEYFGNHLPYMRWWDTGKTADMPATGKVDPYNTFGSLDSIVGVGREGGQSCLIGGGEEKAPAPGTSFDNAKDGTAARNYANYSWGELKLYQARTMQNFHLSCIGRYEKLFKPTAPEDFALTKAGGSYNYRNQSTPWPLGWRGYASDSDPSNRFPNFGRYARQTLIGLDQAQAGDIILWDDAKKYKRLPQVAYVLAAQHERDLSAGGVPYVRTVAYDTGKFPDACGTTESNGVDQTRTLYKSMPEELAKQFSSNNVLTTLCTDPGLDRCVEPNWADAKVYRPTGFSGTQ